VWLNFYHQAKIVRKTDSYCFVTYYDFVSLNNDVNVPLVSKSNEQKNLEKTKLIFSCHLKGH
jgi:hypothetical protein